MIFSKPGEVVFDTSVLLGAAIFEEERKEKGKAKEALRYLNAQCHKLLLSQKIIDESADRLRKEGLRVTDYIIKLQALLDELEEKRKVIIIKRLSKLGFPVPKELKHDIHVLKAAVGAKKGRKGITVCLIHKNPRDFELIKEKMRRIHNIIVLEPDEYIDP